jgi:LmbE family N-acetylglucosaminyl deacetylase
MSKNNRVLIVAAHPDDELIGCAGTIAKHVEDGDHTSILIMAEGSTSRDKNRDVKKRRSQLMELMEHARSAANILGVREIEFAGLSDNRMDSYDLLDIVKLIEEKVTKFRPTIVYTHHRGDLNIDHRVTHDAVVTACRPVNVEQPNKLMTFETLSSTEWNTPTGSNKFNPQIFVNIKNQWPKKVAALSVYKTEMRDFPHPRSIDALQSLAKYRGSACHYEYAEAFMLIRHAIN